MPVGWRSEQAHVLGGLTDVVGYRVGVGDLLFAGDHDVAHERAGLGEDLAEVVFVDLGGRSRKCHDYHFRGRLGPCPIRMAPFPYRQSRWIPKGIS